MYWVYVHDEDGYIVKDLGEFVQLYFALAEATYWLDSYQNESHTVRIVDKSTHNTVWLAGPVDYTNSLTFKDREFKEDESVEVS